MATTNPRSKSHSLSALTCLAGTTFGAVTVVRSTDLRVKIAFAVLSILSFIGYLILAPSGPDLTKGVRQNQFDAGVLSRSSQNLFLAIATSLAGPDQSKWAPIMEDVDHAVLDFPEDVQKDLREAGKAVAASNWIVERFENRWAVSKWYNVEKDADLIAQANTCLKNTANTLKVHGNVSSRILAAKTNGNMLQQRKTTTTA